jgi:hypothetical protein
VAALTKPVLFAAVALALVVVAGPVVVDRLPDVAATIESLADRAQNGEVQSASQISSGEFAQVEAGSSVEALRALAGEPASRSAATVEGVRLECLYYGIVGATGAYQFCFAEGKLRAKLRYARR